MDQEVVVVVLKPDDLAEVYKNVILKTKGDILKKVRHNMHQYLH